MVRFSKFIWVSCFETFIRSNSIVWSHFQVILKYRLTWEACRDGLSTGLHVPKNYAKVDLSTYLPENQAEVDLNTGLPENHAEMDWSTCLPENHAEIFFLGGGYFLTSVNDFVLLFLPINYKVYDSIWHWCTQCMDLF